MILHIAPDEKFISSAYRLFESVLPSGNEFLVVSSSKKLMYTKDIPAKIVPALGLINRKLARSTAQYDAVILHNVDSFRMQLVARAPAAARFVWIGWGSDYYHLIVHDENELLLPLTLEAVKQSKPRPSVVRKAGKRIRDAVFFEKINVAETVNKIEYFSPVLREEYDLVKKVNPDFKPEYIPWNYGSLEENMLLGKKINGNNILIGNNAYYTNNHLDAFEMVHKLGSEGKKIICPLSYGYPWYRELVVRRGRDLFGDSFIPLTDFMPMKDYFDLIGSCSIVIMNQLRQQGIGSISAMLYLGARVFLQPMNPAYQAYKKDGVELFSIEEAEVHWGPYRQMDEEAIVKNRNIINRRLDRKLLRQRTENLIQAITSPRRLK